jgi:hypothetical protein
MDLVFSSDYVDERTRSTRDRLLVPQRSHGIRRVAQTDYDVNIEVRSSLFP